MSLTQVQGGMLAGSTNTTTTIQSNGTTAITIDSSQNVGIGTASPDAKLKVVASGANLLVGFSGTQNYFDASENIFRNFAGTERMRINSGGALLVGTTATSPATADAYGVTINSNTSGNFYAGIIQASSNGSASLLLNRGSDSGNVALFYRSAVNVGNIAVTGSATSYNSGSDYRLKNDIQPITNALQKVALLKPSKWTWKADNTYGDGFVAHELAEVCPHAVTGEKDAMETYKDNEGNEQTRISPQSVDTSFLVATLTAAIQELNAKVDAQAVEIAALKATP
jgi:hypothetical protein